MAPSQCLVSSTALGEHVSLGPGGALSGIVYLSSACEARLTRGGRWTSPRPCEAALIQTPALVPSGCGQAAPLEAQFQFPYDVVTVPVSVLGARHPGAC